MAASATVAASLAAASASAAAAACLTAASLAACRSARRLASAPACLSASSAASASADMRAARARASACSRLSAYARASASAATTCGDSVEGDAIGAGEAGGAGARVEPVAERGGASAAVRARLGGSAQPGRGASSDGEGRDRFAAIPLRLPGRAASCLAPRPVGRAATGAEAGARTGWSVVARRCAIRAFIWPDTRALDSATAAASLRAVQVSSSAA